MLNKLFSREFFSERPLMIANGLALLSMTITVLRVLTTVRQHNSKVGVSYTEYGADTLRLGEWYTLYEFAIFALISTLAAVFISARMCKVDKPLSYTVIILQHVVLVFLFIVSGALLSASNVAA